MGKAFVNTWRAVGVGLSGVAMLALVAAPARAAELKALVAGAVRDVVKDLAEEHTRATGVKAELFFGAMGPLKAKLVAGERVDLVILTPVVFKEMIGSGTAFFDRLVGKPAQARFGTMGFEAVK